MEVLQFPVTSVCAQIAPLSSYSRTHVYYISRLIRNANYHTHITSLNP